MENFSNMYVNLWPLHKILTDARVRCHRKTVVQDQDFMQIRLMHVISLISNIGEPKPIRFGHGEYRRHTGNVKGHTRMQGGHMVMWRCTEGIQGCAQRHRGHIMGLICGHIGDGVYRGWM